MGDEDETKKDLLGDTDEKEDKEEEDKEEEEGNKTQIFCDGAHTPTRTFRSRADGIDLVQPRHFGPSFDQNAGQTFRERKP